jgi:hypothetical protein
MSMSDRPELRVDPTAPARAAEPLRASNGMSGRPVPAEGFGGPARPPRHADEQAVATAGQLRPAYAQYVVDPHTHEVSVCIRDAATDQVLDQIPSAEVAAMERLLRDYAEALARKHAAAEGKAGA